MCMNDLHIIVECSEAPDGSDICGKINAFVTDLMNTPHKSLVVNLNQLDDEALAPAPDPVVTLDPVPGGITPGS